MDIKNIIGQMTLEEKASFCSGADRWHTEKLERLGIPDIMMADGPHGLRKQFRSPEDPTKYKGAVQATCFPSGAGLAATWNKELIYKLGEALAAEAKSEQISILLGPGINMKRSPLCGRNFEYYSEDPYLAGKIAANYINGVQTHGVGTSLKHFAVNNQEHYRHCTNAVVDMRTLREIYLTAFEIAVKESQPATIMHSYNWLNGDQVSRSKWLLTDILRNEWGFKGTVISDWSAVNDRVASLEAGCDLEMPSSYGVRDKEIVRAVRDGKLDEAVLDTALERLLNTVYTHLPDENAEKSDLAKGYEFCSELGEETMVLLKNEKNILPIEEKKPLAVIGSFAKTPRYQGGGSSHVTPAYVDDILACIEERNGGQVLFSEGYILEGDINTPDEALISDAVEIAKKCGRAIIFAGLPDSFESEGYDRQSMALPDAHNELIARVVKEVPDTVVVLLAGSPVEMPWLDDVTTLLYAYLGGCAIGKVVTKLIYGDANPSGKLAETFPIKIEDTPSYLNFPGTSGDLVYAEGVFIGYRYYQKKKMKVNFPFGFGLSYTTFSYDEIKVDGDKVTVRVTNTGKVGGKEAVQLYIGAKSTVVERPVKELKGFEKIYLEPGESKYVEFSLDDRSYAYYDVRVNNWRVETGDYTVYVGGSSENTPLTAVIHKEDEAQYVAAITTNTPLLDIMTNDAYELIREDIISKVFPTDYLKDRAKIESFAKRYYTLRMLVPLYQGAFNEDMLKECIAEANAKLLNK